MNVAALELCKELYELSGWGEEETSYHWYKQDGQSEFSLLHVGYCEFYRVDEYYPAYDLGYLLRKLLPWFKYDGHSSVYLYLSPATDGETWFAGYSMPNGNTPNHPGKRYEYDIVADTPEDAACKLTIELFKQKILTKEIQSS